MFDCDWTRELLDRYLDHELEFDQAKKIAEHLKACGECRHAYELIRLQNEMVTSSIKNHPCDTAKLRAEIEAATLGQPDS
jgi:predicted anti-sigma-YlaC factor YlaD